VKESYKDNLKLKLMKRPMIFRNLLSIACVYLYEKSIF